jgi:hypothetical protein
MVSGYIVVQPFQAVKPFSGAERQFVPGEEFSCDSGQHGESVTIEFDRTLYVIDHTILKNCCRLHIGGGIG